MANFHFQHGQKNKNFDFAFLFYGKSQNFHFLTILKVKISHIFPKQKSGIPNFLYVVKYVKIYQERHKKLDKNEGQILPWTKI